MGKSRRNRIRLVANSNPLAQSVLTNSDFFEDQENEQNTSANPIEAIRNQLQNSNVEEKINGLQSLAVLANSKEKVAAVCGTDVIRIAAPLLCEPDEAVRNAAAGALRNLSVAGSEICDILVEQDVLTPLLELLKQFANDLEWKPTFDRSMRDQLDLHSDVFLQSINLLWNLCESTSIALDLFNQTQLLEGFLRCLDFNVYGQEIAISVAQCLLVVSESNPKCWTILTQHIEIFLVLLNLSDEPGLTYLRTLGAGIISNVPALSAAYAGNILIAGATTLNQNHQQVLEQAKINFPGHEQNGRAVELDINMDATDDETEDAARLRRRRQELPTNADIIVRDISYLIDAQRVAAETITNLCSTEEEEWMDDDEMSENESVTDYNMENMNGNDIINADKLSVALVEAIKSVALVEKLWQRSQPINDVITNFLRENSISLLIKVKHLRISSLICLQNLCNYLSTEELGGSQAIYNVWVELGQQVFKGPKDVATLEPATSLMRSALDHLKHNPELFNQMTESDLELMLTGVQNCSVAEIRANWLRMLGTLGCLLPEKLVSMIILCIIETCTCEENVWTISEAMDALMDMFSDNDWNHIIVNLNLPEKIKEMDKIFKTKIRQQKRELKERYPAVQTVRTNLSRFVKYIEEEAQKI